MKFSSALFSGLVASALVFSGCATTDSKNTTSTTTPSSSEVPSTEQTDGTGSSSQTVDVKSLPKKGNYPYGIKTKWPGLVKSPYAQDKTLVDVSALAPNTPARCPHTGKIFIVP